MTRKLLDLTQAKKIHVRQLRNELCKEIEAQSPFKLYMEISDLLFSAGVGESHVCAGLAFAVLAYTFDLRDFCQNEQNLEEIEQTKNDLLILIDEFENSKDE